MLYSFSFSLFLLVFFIDKKEREKCHLEDLLSATLSLIDVTSITIEVSREMKTSKNMEIDSLSISSNHNDDNFFFFSLFF